MAVVCIAVAVGVYAGILIERATVLQKEKKHVTGSHKRTK